MSSGLGISQVSPEPQVDPRPRLKILRLLLRAGLMNSERNARHRKQNSKIICACGATPDLEHISWRYTLFQTQRAPALENLPHPLESLPTCFRNCAIVPARMRMSTSALHVVQSSLVDVWQAHMSNRQYSFIRNLIAAGHGRPKPCKATGTFRSDAPNR